MPKKLQYTSEEIVFLGQILLEIISKIIFIGSENLAICDGSFIEQINEKITEDKKIKSKLTKALKNCRGEVEQISINKAEGMILKIFDEEYEVGSDERNRITARIRGKREKVKLPIKLAENYLARSTIEDLEDLREEAGFTEEMSINEVVLKLIEYFDETQEEEF